MTFRFTTPPMADRLRYGPLVPMLVALVGCQGQPRSAAGDAALAPTAARVPVSAAVARPSAPTTSSPDATIDRFLSFYFHGYRSGLPSKAERTLLSPMVTAEFAMALDNAMQAERCDYERHHGTEPPLLQGDLFSSLFEKASGILGTTAMARDATSAEYALRLEYRLPGAARAETTWTDSVHLQLVGGQWRIYDFVHRGDWDFSSKGSVRVMLDDIAKLCAEKPAH